MMTLKETLVKKVDKVEEVVYEGFYRVLNKYATPIEKSGDLYKPKDAEEAECLEYQVKMGRVTKRTV